MYFNIHVTATQVIGVLMFSALVSVKPVLADTPAIQVGEDLIEFSQGEVRDVTITPGDTGYLLAAISFDGVVSLSADGELLDSFEPDNELSEIVSIRAVHTDLTGGDGTLLVAMADWTRFRILLRGLDPHTGRFVKLENLAEDGIVGVPPRTRHLCFGHDIYDNSLYLFAGGDHGGILQFRIYRDASGQINFRELQQIVIGGPTTSCYSDDTAGLVYVTEPDMGLWRVISDTEEVPLREPVVLNAPYGELSEVISVAGVVRENDSISLLADVDNEAFYRVTSTGEIVDRRSFEQTLSGIAPVGDVVAIATGRLKRNGVVQHKLAIAITGDANNDSIVLLPLDPEEKVGTGETRPAIPDAVVLTRAISAPVTGGIDAADDPAIWIHPDDPDLSLVLGADKGAGLGVYDLNGSLLQFLADGRINNVDVRANVSENPALAHIAVGSDRTNYALAIYAIDPAARHVRRVDARTVPVEFNDVYGLCMYHSPGNGDLYAFGTSGDGWLHQWRLFEVGGNSIDAELVRRIHIGTVTEGCVVDDEHGYLYAAEERVGVWRYGAEPGDGDQRAAVAMIKEGGVLTADLEGVAVYDSGRGDGYLVVTSQGSDNYSVYDRRPPHGYRGTFRIRTNPESGFDGTSQTDGIDITSVPLPGYPQGLLVAQDGRYDQSQNFKYVSWQDIAVQLGLD
jgi:3-phytase